MEKVTSNYIKSNLSSERGNSLLVVTIGISVVFISMLSIFSTVMNAQGKSDLLRAYSSRSTLEVFLRRTVKFGPALYYSMQQTGNSQLKNCIVDDSAYGYAAMDCDASTEHVVEIYIDPLTDPKTPRVIGSDADHSVFFDLDGEICDDINAPRCAFKVYSSFVPDCGGASLCNQALTITFKVAIDPTPQFDKLQHYEIVQSVYITSGGRYSLARAAEHEPPPPPPPDPNAPADPPPLGDAPPPLDLAAVVAANSNPAPTPTPTPTPVPVTYNGCSTGFIATNMGCKKLSF